MLGGPATERVRIGKYISQVTVRRSRIVSIRRARRRLRVAGLATFAFTTDLLLLVPALSTAVAPAAARPSTGAVGCAGTPVSNGVSANVLWNGVNVCSYSSASSSLSVDFSKSADIRYFWNATPTASVSVNDARLEMFYFGFTLVTRDQIASVAQSGTGTFDMSWDPGVLTYVLEGLYGLTASLIAPNGSTVWSEHFFVTAKAPLSVLAALPILLLVIAIYEAYALAVSGRQAGLGRGRAPSPPTEAAAPVPPPAGETAPPAGGPPPESEEEKT